MKKIEHRQVTFSGKMEEAVPLCIYVTVHVQDDDSPSELLLLKGVNGNSC